MRVLRAPHVTLLAICLVLVGTSSCKDEVILDEPAGGYMAFRDAVLETKAGEVYECLDKETKDVYETRLATLQAMDERISKFLPQVDRRLAREQTGVVLLKEKNLQSGKDLFVLLFQGDQIIRTEGLENGTAVSYVETNDTGKQAVVKTYANVQYHMVKEEDDVWRVAQWKELSEARTKWIVDNKSTLEQTVEDLINEEKEEVDKVIAFLLKEEKKRKSQ